MGWQQRLPYEMRGLEGRQRARQMSGTFRQKELPEQWPQVFEEQPRGQCGWSGGDKGGERRAGGGDGSERQGRRDDK